MKRLVLAAMVAAAMAAGQASVAEGSQPANRIGAGAHYWRAVRTVDFRDVDQEGLSWLASYQRRPGTLLSIEANLEWFRSGFGGSAHSILAPQLFLLAGSTLYVGAGAGLYWSDGAWSRDPFYALRAGLDLHVLPRLHLDLNANYRFENWDDLNEPSRKISSDTVTLGAAVRVAF